MIRWEYLSGFPSVKLRQAYRIPTNRFKNFGITIKECLLSSEYTFVRKKTIPIQLPERLKTGKPNSNWTSHLQYNCEGIIHHVTVVNQWAFSSFFNLFTWLGMVPKRKARPSMSNQLMYIFKTLCKQQFDKRRRLKNWGNNFFFES